MVTASASGVARLWRIHDGALEWELYGHDVLICVVLHYHQTAGLWLLHPLYGSWN